jgi:hypothetical protein
MFELFRNSNLPDYLERAFSPLTWSNIFSQDFKDEVAGIIMSSRPKESLDNFRQALEKIEFLNEDYKETLLEALERFINEKRNPEK